MSPAGLEPTTDALEKRCSVQLSYEDNTRSPVVLATSRRSYVIQVVQFDYVAGLFATSNCVEVQIRLPNH